MSLGERLFTHLPRTSLTTTSVTLPSTDRFEHPCSGLPSTPFSRDPKIPVC